MKLGLIHRALRARPPQPSPTPAGAREGVGRRLLAVALMVLCGAARAATDCPSPEACLARALSQQWAAYDSYIAGAWNAYREDRALNEQARKLGRADLIAATQERLSYSERVYKHARAMAEAIADPALGSYMASALRRTQSQLQDAQTRLDREQHLLDGYLRTSGPARDTAMRDMVGYAKEADRLIVVQAIDTAKTASYWASEKALALAEAGKLGPYAETGRQLGEQAMLAAHVSLAGIEGAHAEREGDLLKASLEAAGSAGTMVTGVARMAKAHALKTIGGAEFYAGLLAVTLDTCLMVQNAVLVEEARQRSQELGLHEQRFNERVVKAQVEVRRMTKLRDHAQEQIDQRQRIGALLERMQAEP
jgi:hypothetical protein